MTPNRGSRRRGSEVLDQGRREAVARWKKGERTIQFLIGRARLETVEIADLAASAEALIARAALRVEATAAAALKAGRPRRSPPSRARWTQPWSPGRRWLEGGPLPPRAEGGGQSGRPVRQRRPGLRVGLWTWPTWITWRWALRCCLPRGR